MASDIGINVTVQTQLIFASVVVKQTQCEVTCVDLSDICISQLAARL